MLFNFSKPKGSKHKSEIKAGILILVITPKLVIKRAKTAKIKPLKITTGKITLYFVLNDSIIPLTIKNKKNHQAITSGKAKKCLG